jgi:type IV pilus assembly protein PilY1
MLSIRNTGKKVLISAAISAAISLPAAADDLDVYNAIFANQLKPNLLFVLDYSGSMQRDVDGNWLADQTDPASRISILKEAVKDVLQRNTGRINAGIGSIYDTYPSGVKWPITDLEDDAHIHDSAIPPNTVSVADVISSQLERVGAGGRTTTVNALAEAAAYFRGDQVFDNDSDVLDTWDHTPDVWQNGIKQYGGGNQYAALPQSYTPSNALDRTNDTWTTPTYNSPIVSACQSNFIVLISDGRPNEVNDTPTMQTVLSAAGASPTDPANITSGCEDLKTSIFGYSAVDGGTEITEGNCGPEITNYLATNDINPEIPGSNVKTFTVGFATSGTGSAYLDELAKKGQGDFFQATQPSELTEALDEVINSILAGTHAFAELSLEVDRANYAHDNRTFYSLFTPTNRPSWTGNLKGYFIDQSGLVDIKGDSAIINDGSGARFADTSHSFWSALPDGNELAMGGFNESVLEQGAAANRNLYTYTGGAVPAGGVTVSMGLANTLHKDNTSITTELMGLNSGQTVESDAALDWIQTAPMGAPLHTKPVMVNYGGQQVLYVMTNQGFLHAIDASNPSAPDNTAPDTTGGEELFAFMPGELLDNLHKHYTGKVGDPHIYGLDGAITRWHDDANNDGIVNGTDTVLLVFGMRRGGNTYYAMDVTDPTSPSLKWKISGGDANFAELQQSWSRASLVPVKLNGVRQKVLMFGGGFDPAMDNILETTPGSGNAIFVVSKAGNLIKKITHVDMIYSIPSDLTVIDTNSDAIADRIYVGDLGGRVWRVDFQDLGTADPVTVTQLADLSINAADHQPIFYPPSVAMNNQSGKRFLSVAVGTGDRTQPLLTDTNNRIVMLRDLDYGFGAPATPVTPITPNDLHDATQNNIGSTNDTVKDAARADLAAKHGWKIDLNPDEKSLSQLLTFEGKIMATTFEPLPNSGADPCGFESAGRLYTVRVADARPVVILPDGTEDTSDQPASSRITPLEAPGIPSKPVKFFSSDDSNGNGSGNNTMVGTEAIPGSSSQIKTVFWHAR